MSATRELSMKQRSLSTGDLKSSLRSGEQQTKIVTQNIEKIETHYPQIVQDLNYYVVRTAKLRDSGDTLHKSLLGYSQDESPMLKRGLDAFSECFAAVQDHRSTLISRLENKVLQKFAVYETRCKQARQDLRQHSQAHLKELNQHKTLEKVKSRSPSQNFKVTQAETKFQKAADEANRSSQILNDQVSEFERQKVRDLKTIYGDFMLSEMMFYAKALEIYTKGYQELMKVDEEEDVNHLQTSLKWSPHSFGAGRDIEPYGGSAPNLSSANSPNLSVHHLSPSFGQESM